MRFASCGVPYLFTRSGEYALPGFRAWTHMLVDLYGRAWLATGTPLRAGIISKRGPIALRDRRLRVPSLPRPPRGSGFMCRRGDYLRLRARSTPFPPGCHGRVGSHTTRAGEGAGGFPSRCPCFVSFGILLRGDGGRDPLP